MQSRHGLLVCLLLAFLLGCTSGAPRSSGDFPLGTGALPPFADRLARFAELNLDEELDLLVLSGGGQNGAFGAGVAKGWREAGRPRFDMVTGVSTGALLSSFYFLDTPAADDLIGRFYTNSKQSDIACRRGAVRTVLSDAALDSAPLEGLIRKIVDDAFIDRIAEASEGGKRLLLAGTTNLDSGGYRVWDLSALARHKQYDRYRAVMLASASPPGGFPPVYIDGEMHVDGGVRANVFLPYLDLHLSPERLAGILSKSKRPDAEEAFTTGTLHVVMNRVLTSPAQRIEPGFVPIVKRGLDLVIDSVTHGSLWYVYTLVTERGGTFRMTAIPETHEADAQNAFAFDQAAMKRLYEAGLAAGRSQADWKTRPPPLQPDLR